MKNFKNNRFAQAFKKVLLEADVPNTDLVNDIEANLDGSPMKSDVNELDVMSSTLDPDATPEDYLTDPATDKALQQQIDQRNQEIASVIEGWSTKLDDFIEFLNGTDEKSLRSILAKAQPGTLMAKVQASTSRKLANAATELAGLSQMFKSFVGQKVITQK